MVPCKASSMTEAEMWDSQTMFISQSEILNCYYIYGIIK